ncbi:MAG TPA: ascorbate-dependent monooxygenase [Methylomirabilota bacterium]
MRRLRMLAIVTTLALLGGCESTPPRPSATTSRPPTSDAVTFTRDVAPLLQRHCQECHRPESVAPFGLLRYEDAYSRRAKIRKAVTTRKMPPWKAVPGYGEFADVRRLAESEIDVISRWVATGAPEGDPRDLPAPRRFSTGWALSRPSAVIAMEEPFTVPPRTSDLYRCFTVPIRIAGDWRFIRASEVLPGNRKVVHHVQTFLDRTGRSVELDQAEPGPGYTCFGGPGFDSSGGLGGWVPGLAPIEIPPRVAWGIPPGARLVIQVHYHNPGDTPQTDVTRVGVHFTSRPFERRLNRVRPSAWNFVIPARAPRARVVATASVDEDFEAMSVNAHMHLLGREMTVTAHLPDGTRRPLLRIDDWDFEWQLLYSFRRPVSLPAGTVVEAECVYDNSATNPRNPSSPPRTVTSGFETTDEMCLASVLGTTRLAQR